MPSPRIRAEVPARKEWAIKPDGRPARVSMQLNGSGPLMYATDGSVLVKQQAQKDGWLALASEMPPDLYAEFLEFQDLCDRFKRKSKPSDWPETNRALGIPEHLIPAVSRERLGLGQDPTPEAATPEPKAEAPKPKKHKKGGGAES